jgi:transcriptional regulator with XRE-family HTH domain
MNNEPGALGRLLREARCAASLTQNDLSEKLNVSQRHLSYVEQGRARASRALIEEWLDAAQAPHSMRSAVMLHAGFAPAAEPQAGENLAHLPLARALIAAHEPWPAMCFDAQWMLVDANAGRARAGDLIIPDVPGSIRHAASGVDMIDLLSRPGGLLSCMRQAPVVGWSLLSQLRAEGWANDGLRARTDAFEQHLRKHYPQPAAALVRPAEITRLPLDFDTPVGVLSFLAVQLTPGLPQNITAQSLRVALWYPADERTRRAMTGTAA